MNLFRNCFNFSHEFYCALSSFVTRQQVKGFVMDNKFDRALLVHKRTRRFNDIGEYLNDDNMEDEDEKRDEERITPPEQLELITQIDSGQFFPDLYNLLSIPIPYIIALVRNKVEAGVLYKIRQLSLELTIITKYLSEELQSAEVFILFSQFIF